jgi:hypothetical protein
VDLTHLALTPAGAQVRVVTYTLDDVGNRTSETDARNNVTVHEYDRRNQLVRTIYPSTESTDASDARKVSGRAVVDRTYDANGNLHLLIDEEGRVSTGTKN